MKLSRRRTIGALATAAVLIIGDFELSTADAQRGRGGGARSGSRGGSRGGGSSRRSGGGGSFRRSSGGGSIRRSSGGSIRRSSGGSIRRSTGSSGFRRGSSGSGIGGIQRGSTRGSNASGFRRGSSGSGIGGIQRGSTRGTNSSGFRRSGNFAPNTSRTNRSNIIRNFNNGNSNIGRWNFNRGGNRNSNFNQGNRTSNFNRGGSNRINQSGFIRSGRSRRNNSFGSRWAGVNIGGFGFGGGIRNRGFGNRGGLRRSWGFWLSNGYRGWGLGFGNWGGIGYFDYAFAPPIVEYYNPYCETAGFFPVDNSVYNYSQPIVQSGGTNDAGVNGMAAADEAFRNGDYRTALASVDLAVKEMPQNADVHQFRSMVLFAMANYRDSAAAAHVALSGGRGWNWETLRSFYPSVQVYTQQMRALERYAWSDQKPIDGRFLLGYHYMMLGYPDNAGDELYAVVQAEPRDKLAAELLTAISKKTGKQYGLKKQNSGPTTPPSPAKSGPTIAKKPIARKSTPATLRGSWKSIHADGTAVTLKLLSGGKFEWSAVKGTNTTKLEGTFVAEKDQLKLTSARNGQVLAGTLTLSGKNEFQLKLKFQPEDDPPLKFKRQ